MIHCTHIPRLLKEQGYDIVGFSTGKRGLNILKNNPFIDRIHFAELNDYIKVYGINYYNSRLTEIGRDYDKVINLNQIIEVSVLPGQFQREYFLDQKLREKNGGENYYDYATIAAGYPHLLGKYKGELFFSKEEDDIVAEYMKPYEGKFKVLVNLSGSSPHKAFVQAAEVIDRIKEKYPEAIVFTTGDKLSEGIDSKREDVVKLSNKKPFRQVLCMCKHMDCVIGCESGMMCGASCLGVPTIQLLTAASWVNHCKYAEKDYSLQSPCRCSPCHKNPYDYWGCPKKDHYPLCVYFDVNKILEKVDRIYDVYSLPRTAEINA